MAITPIVNSQGPGRKYIYFNPNFSCHLAHGNLVVYWLCCANIGTIAKQFQFMAPMAIKPVVNSKVPGRKYIYFSPNFSCHLAHGNLVVYWLCCANIGTIAKQFQFMALMAIMPIVNSKGPGRKYIYFSPTFCCHLAYGNLVVYW
jgi:hypothetical protein